MTNNVTNNAPARERKTRITYSDAVVAIILGRIAEGESLNQICNDDGMPARKSFFDWVAKYPALRERYETAMAQRADVIAEEILTISNKPPSMTDQGAIDSGDVAHRKLQIDARKWYLSKLAPKKYGDKQQVDIGNADGKPFVTSDADAATKLAAIITAGLARKAADLADLV